MGRRLGVTLAMAAALAAGCQRGSLDGSPADAASIAVDGGALGPNAGAPGPGAGAGAGAGAGTPGGSGGDVGMPGVPSCVVTSLTPQGWTEVPVPSALAGFQITDAWAAPGIGRDDLFLAATLPPLGDPPIAAMRIARLSRGCWTIELSWSTPSNLPPSVTGSAANDVWATVGDGLIHRDDAGWSRADDPLRALLAAQHPGAVAAFQLARVGEAGMWVTGGRYVWHRDRRRAWRMFEVADGDILGPVHSIYDTFWFTALAPERQGDGVALGGTIDISGSIPDVAFVHRYDGSAWSFHSVSTGRVGALASDGYGGLWIGVPSGGWGPSLIHLTGAVIGDPGGSASQSVSVSQSVSIDGWPQGAEAQALWSRGGRGDDIWAAAGSYLAHYDGSAWTAIAGPPQSGSPATIGGSTVTILTGDAGSIWFVAGARLFRRGF